MAKRRKKHKADKSVIIEAFAEMAKTKNIDRDLLQGIVEETLVMIIKKKHGPDASFEIIVNMEKGDVEIYLTRTVVEKVEDPNLEISLEEAIERSDDDDYEVGEEFIEEITLDNISDSFGRRLVSLAYQNLNQRIREVEKDNVYNEYIQKLGEIIIGEIYQVRRNDILVMHSKIEMRLPREEQIPNEPYRFKKNQTIKAIIKEVRRSGPGGQPEIVLSRASEEFLARLFEIEIPEIYDGIIQIKAIARDPGERSKVAVQSFDDRVDPVGACVGMKGIRIHSIVRELNNENIDLIEYSENMDIFITRALSPAKINEIKISNEMKTADVVVPDDQVSLAIGKNGQNVRLASKLTGFSISLIKEGGEDIDIAEFKEELGQSIYEQIIDSDIETAREFLDADLAGILSIEGMTKDFLLEMRQIMLAEFEEEEEEDIEEKIDEALKAIGVFEEKEGSEEEPDEEVTLTPEAGDNLPEETTDKLPAADDETEKSETETE
jgi:N utilization substance protein A